MIKAELVDYERQQYVVKGNEPFRLVNTVTDSGRTVVFVYRGVEGDQEQPPVGAIDFSQLTKADMEAATEQGENDALWVAEDGERCYP